MRRTLVLILGVFALTLAPAAYGQTQVSTLTNGLSTFVNNATASLPFASAAGLDWSDAYIGSIVGVPPHFGIGIVTGATTIPGKNLNPLISALGGSLPYSDLPIPLAAVNARIGGFLLPFDVGLKVGTIPGGVTLNNYTISYQNYGFDVRYALFQGEPLLPDVSVGGGVDYFSSEITTPTLSSSASYSDGNGHTLGVGSPNAVLDLSALTFEAKLQVSKSLLILTPYLGLSGLVGSSTAKATVNATVTGVNSTTWSVPGLSSTGFSQSNSQAAFGLKVYGGTSINLFVFKLDLQGMYSFLDGAYGGTIGARFQL
jgi:hypothetical protein